jgi:putative heme-binding domain-containing protein
MNDILNPGLSIADGYDIWLLQLTSGETVQGLIETETPTAITLNNYGGQKTTIARHDIQSLKALGMSAMPAGLEKQITPQQMADLLAFIRQAKKDDK